MKYIIYFVTVLLLFITASIKFYYWEPDGIKSGSLAYYLKVNNKIKRFPIFNASNQPEYRVVTAEGIKPSMTILDYETKDNKTTLLRSIKNNNFSCAPALTKGYYFCERKDNNHDISIMIEQNKELSVLIINTTFIGF